MPKTFGLIVPVYNEEKTLDAMLDRILAIPRVQQIVVVNDGSNDRTAAILKERLDRGDGRLVVVTQTVNQGKGAAIRSAITRLETDFAAIQDADSEYDPEDLQPIFTRLDEGSADVVFGSRFIHKNPNLYRSYLWGNKLITHFINTMGGGRLTDSYTCYKAMSVNRWRRLELQSSGFEIEAEISTKCLLARWRLVEIPITYAPRSFAQGEKIRPSDALKGMMVSLRLALTRNYPRAS